jgi:hypothetical protein
MPLKGPEEMTHSVAEHIADHQSAIAIVEPAHTNNIFGYLLYKSEPKSVEEMDAGIRAEARRRFELGRY